MPSVKFIGLDGSSSVVEVEVDTTLMQAAKSHDIKGIEGECGGACACATCHCYIEDGWIDRIKPASAFELEMLDCVIDLKPNSRLGCQIAVSADLDGITIRIPKAQY